MTHFHNSWMRVFALILAVLTVFGFFPMMNANASTIADGSTTCDVVPINQRQFLLTTTAGKRLGAYAYRYTTNDGLSGSAYCIDHVLNMTQHTLEIRGEYNASPATAGAFANGYPQHSLETFLGRFPGETMLNGLTEQEYMYATQIAVWATLGQLGIEGSSFTAGNETVAQPVGDAQQIRVFRAVQLILHSAEQWDRIYHTGMYIRLEENELGGNISIPGDMTLEYAADRQQDVPVVRQMFDDETLNWAKSFGIVPDTVSKRYYNVDTATVLLNGFIQQTREAFQALGLFERSMCSAGMYDENVKGKVLVMKPSTLKEQYWTIGNQLWLAESGFGCDPKSSGRAIYAVCLSDGEHCRWNREDFVGVLDEKYLPEWAKQKLEEIQAPEQDTTPSLGNMELR